VLELVYFSDEPLYLVESEKKALAVAQLGLPAVAFCGIEGWHVGGRMKARSTRPPKLRLTREQRAFAAMQARLRARLESLKFSPHERAHVERLLAAASLPPASPEVELVRLFEIPDGPTRQQWRQHLLEERQAPRATETSP
jgi:hypothetical protein